MIFAITSTYVFIHTDVGKMLIFWKLALTSAVALFSLGLSLWVGLQVGCGEFAIFPFYFSTFLPYIAYIYLFYFFTNIWKSLCMQYALAQKVIFTSQVAAVSRRKQIYFWPCGAGEICFPKEVMPEESVRLTSPDDSNLSIRFTDWTFSF